MNCLRFCLCGLLAWTLVAQLPAAEEGEANVSVFSFFVQRIAKERGVSLGKAAELLYDAGVRGFDIGVNDPKLPELAATKLKPINVYAFPRLLDAEKGPADVAQALATAKRYGVPRVMVVPPNFSKGEDEGEFLRLVQAMRGVVAAAKAQGVTVTVEDFGGVRNPCSHLKYLKRFLAAIPDLRFALDSGNLYYAGRGDDILELLDGARDRIAHVHLKDQPAADNRAFVTLGAGAVPNERIVRTLAARGYRGWYTLENPAGNDTYADTLRQLATLRAWCGAKAPSAP